MQNVKSNTEINKQALSIEEMEVVGGGFLLGAIAGAMTVFAQCFYDFADFVSVGLFGLPKPPYHH